MAVLMETVVVAGNGKGKRSELLILLAAILDGRKGILRHTYKHTKPFV